LCGRRPGDGDRFLYVLPPEAAAGSSRPGGLRIGELADSAKGRIDLPAGAAAVAEILTEV